MVRPRSQRAHESVLDAALTLFAERGIEATSMDAIADASGVSKATIYKHWPDKDTLCLDVMRRLHGRDATAPPEIAAGDLRTALIAVLSHRPPAEHGELRTRMMPYLMAYAARNPSFGRAWQASVFDPPRARLTEILRRGIAHGLLPRTLDVDLAITLLLGPMMYSHVLTRLSGVEVTSPEQVVDAFLRSYGVATSQAAAGEAARHRVRARRRRAHHSGAR